MIFRLLLAQVLALAILLPSISHAQNASGPQIGARVEDFQLTDQYGETQKLSDLLADGPIALVAIRSAGWCPKCKDQLIQLQSDFKSFRKAGLRIVALSFDSVEVLKDFSDLNKIEFPLLSDPKSKVIQQLGIINTTRKKGTLRYRVAHPLTIMINADSTVAGVVTKTTNALPNSKQLLAAWDPIKPDEPLQKLPFISVLGNKFVNQNGEQVVFKGLAIADPDKTANDGHWNKQHFETVKSWGVTLIRIPVHPARYRKRGQENYLKLLDQAVQWCEDLEMHVIIDWHSIGNLRTEKFEAPEYRTSFKETVEFWSVISERYAGNPTIAFYEIYNEPSLNNGDFGTCTWEQWKEMVEKCIDVIYANDKNVIPLVAGFNWAYDLREVKTNPIDRTGIGYVTHPYPGKCRPPREPHWEEHFGFLADRFPVIASEMGFYTKGDFDYLVDDGSYRKAILKYLDKKKISWCAWVFDPDWSPPLIKSYNYQPTHSGTFFKEAMLGQ